MALTTKQEHDLNNMNKAAQNVQLGTMLKDGVDGSGTTETYVLPAATTSAIGGVKLATNVAEADGDAVTVAQFNALISSLIAAGVMASS